MATPTVCCGTPPRDPRNQIRNSLSPFKPNLFTGTFHANFGRYVNNTINLFSCVVFPILSVGLSTPFVRVVWTL
ncbi:hypothetical protein Trydic_g10640 [Trypoxylus dichotomus]